MPTHLPEMSAPAVDGERLGTGAAGAGLGSGVFAATDGFEAGAGVAATGVGSTVAGVVVASGGRV
jgi:hypothetical protein